MPRPLRIEYQGARYHVLSRGDRREDIVFDDEDRRRFVATLGEGAARANWQVHAFCLMGNHFHLVIETPEPTLIRGMQWMLGTLYREIQCAAQAAWASLFRALQVDCRR